MHDYLLEIEMIADIGSAERGEKRFLRTNSVPPLSARHPNAARAAGMLWIGGVCGSPNRGNWARAKRVLGMPSLAVEATLCPGTSATLNAIDALRKVLTAERLTIKDVKKLTVYATTPGDLAGIDAGIRTAFGRSAPAVTLVGVEALPIPTARVEIEAVAHAPQKGKS
jgi:enamine deaminase RidA (YjgF/YER057c/UK114 family)